MGLPEKVACKTNGFVLALVFTVVFGPMGRRAAPVSLNQNNSATDCSSILIPPLGIALGSPQEVDRNFSANHQIFSAAKKYQLFSAILRFFQLFFG